MLVTIPQLPVVTEIPKDAIGALQLAEILKTDWPAIAGAKSMLGITPVARDAADYPVFQDADADRIRRFLRADPSCLTFRDPGPLLDETGLDQPLA